MAKTAVELVGASRNLNVENVDVPDVSPIVLGVVNVGHAIQEGNVVSVEVKTIAGVNGTIKIEIGFAQSDGSIVYEEFTAADPITGGVLYTHNLTRKTDYVRLTFTATAGTPAVDALNAYVRS